MTEPSQGRASSSLASLIGAILYGRRPDDAAARKKAKRIAASGSALGLVFWLIVEMWNVTKSSIYDERDQNRVQVKAIVMAMKEQTSAIDRQTDAFRKWTEDQALVSAVLLDRISGPLPSRAVPPATIVRPRR